MKITKREVGFFFLGLFTMLLIELVWNWNDNVKAFKEGFDAGYNGNIEVTK